MLKILINAYACSPNMGSEPGMAWNWVSNLAKYCELYIITEGEFRSNIEKWCRPWNKARICISSIIHCLIKYIRCAGIKGIGDSIGIITSGRKNFKTCRANNR